MEEQIMEMPLENLHKKLFETLCFLDRVCREQGLAYYLAYGSLLGAVRHQGFIPWDDDVDVWMPRDDFMKLLEYLRLHNTDERFVLNEGKYKPKGDRPSEFQIRVLDTQTKISRQYAGTRIEAYLWIDIFALDQVPAAKKGQYLKKFKRELLMYKIARCKNFLIVDNSMFGKVNKAIYVLHNKFGMFKNCLKEEKHQASVVKALTRYQTSSAAKDMEYFSYAAVYLGKPEKCFFKKEWFSKPVELQFDGKSFYSPENWDAILKTLYNDYMKLPPEHEKYSHSVKEA